VEFIFHFAPLALEFPYRTLVLILLTTIDDSMRRIAAKRSHALLCSTAPTQRMKGR
jgi:hypothetical protein